MKDRRWISGVAPSIALPAGGRSDAGQVSAFALESSQGIVDAIVAWCFNSDHLSSTSAARGG
jgi:hypothetical protein